MNRPKGMNFRRCNKCREIFHTSNLVKCKEGKFGVEKKCKKCNKEYNKNYYDKNKEDILDKCKIYREEHKEEKRERDKKYKEEHKEYFEEYNKKYYEEHKEEMKESLKKWESENKEHLREYRKNYYLNNNHISFNNATKRRFKENSQGKGIAKEQWYEMMEFFQWTCAYSGEYLGGDNKDRRRTIDHIISLNNGGEHEIWNCVPMLKSYNSSKYDNNMLEWYLQQEYFNIERLTKIYEWRIYAYEKWGNVN